MAELLLSTLLIVKENLKWLFFNTFKGEFCMNRIYVMLIVGIVLAVLLSPAHVFGKQFLVKDGHSDYVIVVANDAIPAEITAAEELKTYLKQLSGADLEIVKEDKYSSGPMIAVGFNGKMSDAFKAQAFGSLGEEELIIKSDKDILLLAGGRPRGALYAVYEFLHNQGVRWYTPAYTKVPSLPTIQLSKDSYRYKSPMRARCEIAGNAPTEKWTVANRMNRVLLWNAPSEKYGGGYSQGVDMHTFWRVIGISVLQAHPDWLAVVDANGNRDGAVGTNWGLCLSNKEVRRYLVDKTYQWAKANPRNEIWIGQNDGSKYCMCDQCKAFYAAHEGLPSSLMVQLVNELADVVASDPNMKGVFVKTLSYGWAATPTPNMTLRDNVLVMFCAPTDFIHPIETDPGSATLRQSIVNWRKIAKNFDTYLYEPYNYYWWTYPSLYPCADNIKWAAQNGINNVYIQISGWMNSYGSDWVDLKAWVYARKMWNPEVDTQELVEDFAYGYYGPAAKAVIEAITLTHKNVFDKNNKAIQYNNSDIVPNFINPATVRAVNKLFEKTYDSLKDPEYKSRLSFAWIGYLWTDFWLGYSKAGSYDQKSGAWMVPLTDSEILTQYAKKVKQFMIEHKVNSYGQTSSLNPYELSLDKMGIAWPANRLANENVEAIVVPGVAGQIFDFKDISLNFAPFKHYWACTISEYPLYSSWRDSINMAYSRDYTVKESKPNHVVLEATIGDFAVSKTVTMQDKVLLTSFVAKANKKSSAQLKITTMFDLTANVFGDYPTLYVEKTGGQWSKRVIGSETVFWYIGGNIDISNTTGRMVLAAQNRPEGVLLTFNPAEVSTVSFQYDRYWAFPSADQGHMLELRPTSSNVTLEAGQTIKMDYSLKILSDANSLIK